MPAQGVAHRHDRITIADLTIGLGTHLAEPLEHLVEAGLRRRPGLLLIPAEPPGTRAHRDDDVSLDGPVSESRGDRLAQGLTRQRLVGHDQERTHDRILQRVTAMMPPPPWDPSRPRATQGRPRVTAGDRRSERLAILLAHLARDL